MSALWATFSRELRAYFLSPLAYAVLFFVLLLQGGLFSLIVTQLSNPGVAGGRPFDVFFGSSWIVLVFVVPILTMRLLAEERKTGSIEVLMTAPVTEGQVVAGKYLAALAFYVVLWLPTLFYALLLERYSDVDWGILGAGYLGIVLIGALFLALGLVASALFKNQIVAAVAAFVVGLLLLLVGALPDLVTEPHLKHFFEYVSVLDHLDEMSRGIVDTRRLAFYLTTTCFALFVASRALEDRKWR